MASMKVWVITGLLFFGATSAVARDSPRPGPEGDGHVIEPDESEIAVRVSFGSDQGTKGRYIPGQHDESVWALQSHINNVRQQWLSSLEHANAESSSIYDSALAYAERLVRIQNNVLGLGALVVRDEYACFGFIMAAANNASSQAQTVLGKRAETLCARAASYLRVARKHASKDASARAVMKWSSSSEEHARIAYLSAMSTCLQSVNAAKDVQGQEAIRILKTIPDYYLARYPPANDAVLQYCVVHR
jgi:hypothetical protein